jgi:hypothetical protein
MLSFEPVTAENILSLYPYLKNQPFRSCDYTIGAIYQWRAYFSAKFAIAGDMLIMTAEYPGEGGYYTWPVGNGNLEEALDAISLDAAEKGKRLRFCTVPEAGKQYLTDRYKDRCIAENKRDWADYLYQLEDHIQFPGKKFHTQRNHLNHFIKEYPDYRFVPVTEETLPAARRFLAEYEQYAPIDKVIEKEEMYRSEELLRAALKLNQKAGYIDVGGTIVALAVGETMGDVLYVHVEKARVDYAGAYQAIVSMFASYAAEPETRLINREDDSGEEGLRFSKMSYRPSSFTEKYWITII